MRAAELRTGSLHVSEEDNANQAWYWEQKEELRTVKGSEFHHQQYLSGHSR